MKAWLIIVVTMLVIGGVLFGIGQLCLTQSNATIERVDKKIERRMK